MSNFHTREFILTTYSVGLSIDAHSAWLSHVYVQFARPKGPIVH